MIRLHEMNMPLTHQSSGKIYHTIISCGLLISWNGLDVLSPPMNPPLLLFKGQGTGSLNSLNLHFWKQKDNTGLAILQNWFHSAGVKMQQLTTIWALSSQVCTVLPSEIPGLECKVGTKLVKPGYMIFTCF